MSTLSGAAAGKPGLLDRQSRKATTRTASAPCTDIIPWGLFRQDNWEERENGLYDLALGFAVLAYFLLKRSTRPSASTIF
jgi:hypothetical protein